MDNEIVKIHQDEPLKHCPNGLCESTNIEQANDGAWDCLDCGVMFGIPLHPGKNPALSILEALFMGLEVELNGNKYQLGYSEKFGFPIIGVPMVRWCNDKPVPFIMDNNVSLNYFLQMCQEISWEDLATLRANIGLNKYNKERKVSYDKSTGKPR